MVKQLKFKEHKEKREKNLLRLDLGTGKAAKKPAGFLGVDIHKWKGVDVILNLVERTARFVNSADRGKPHGGAFKAWPWKTGSVDEVNADQLLQYFTPSERVHFANELYRVLKSGGKAVLVVPNWAASKAYIDLDTHWPPVSEAWFHTLNKGWRDAQNRVDTSDFKCDFEPPVIGYGMHPMIMSRNQEYQQTALAFWKEAAQDIYATLTKK